MVVHDVMGVTYVEPGVTTLTVCLVSITTVFLVTGFLCLIIMALSGIMSR